MVDLSPAERLRFKEKRVKLGYTHRSLSARTGVSPGSISNIETGRSGQVSRENYAKVYAVLFSDNPPEGVEHEQYKHMIENLVLRPDLWSAVTVLAESTKKQK